MLPDEVPEHMKPFRDCLQRSGFYFCELSKVVGPLRSEAENEATEITLMSLMAALENKFNRVAGLFHSQTA